ncbi:MAG: LytTR family transcriptional regulator [Bacteroidales bacterium]|nr:LytTR family transcriptional regulator [Bacteroidales bacterium]
MRKILPSYFFDKKNIIQLLLFVTFFVLLFIVIFKPFNSNTWIKGMSKDKFVIYSILMVTIGLGVLTVSRIVMFLLRNKIKVFYWNYLIWLFGEIIFISLFCTLFAWLIHPRQVDFFAIFPYTFAYSSSILLLPYIISWLYFELKDKKRALESEKSLRLQNGDKTSAPNTDLINFTDEKGVLKLSVSIDNLFYIAAADNYVNVCYINKEKVGSFILRNSLKNIEETYTNANLVRCHRSYIVNRTKVKVMRRDKDGLYIELDSKSIPDIPISKTYAKQVIDLFTESSIE